MTDTGRMTPNGFLPSEPSMNALFERIGFGGFDGRSPAAETVEDARFTAADDLKRSYAQLFATPAGTAVLEDLLDQSLRRAGHHPGGNVSLDVQTAYGLERMGQNGMVTYILKMIHDGRKLPAPGAKKRGRK